MPPPPGSVRFFVLTELTLPYFVLMVLMGRQVCVIDRQPLVLSDELMDRVTAWAGRRGAGHDIRDLLPATKRFWIVDSPNTGSGSFFDYYAKTEPGMAQHYRYRSLDEQVPAYAAPCKGVIGNYYDNHVYQIYMMRDIEASGLALGVWGLNGDIRAYYRNYWGCEPALPLRCGFSFNRLVNLIQAVAASAIILTRMAKQLRLNPPAAEDVPVAADMLEGKLRTVRLIEDITCGDIPVLYVARNSQIKEEARTVLEGRPLCCRTDGVLPLTWIVWALGVAFGHVARLFLAAGHLHPRIVREIYGLCYWRVTYRTLLRRYRTRFFLGRDDYTPEHHVRTQELRRLGCKSLGIRHGLSWTGIHAGFCCIDFDYYYTFGESHSELEYFSPHYPPHMILRSVGSWGMTRAELDRCPKDGERPRDILVGTSNSPGGKMTAIGVGEVAAAFPDRTVYFRPKAIHYPKVPELDEAIQRVLLEPPPNVELDDKKSYEIFHKVSYYIGNVSSFVAEAIQYGVISFCIDVGFEETYEPRPFSYRHYPFILVRDIAEAIERIRAIEAGTWRYPSEQAGTLIDLSGRVVFDVIRADMGLPPKAPLPG